MIESYSISPDGLKGVRKYPIVWAHKKDDNSIYPIMYLRKPKHLDEAIWRELVGCVKLSINEELAKKL